MDNFEGIKIEDKALDAELSPNPLYLPEVLSAVFKFVSNKNLKTCREVSVLWNQISCETLDQRTRTGLNTFVINLDAIAKRRLLINYFQQPHLPCRDIALSTHSLDLQMKTILENFGKSLIGLQLKFTEESFPLIGSANQLRDLLTVELPNLQKLELNLENCVQGTRDPTIQLFHTPTKLPLLRKFSVRNVVQRQIGLAVITEILSAAENLQEFDARCANPVGRMTKRSSTKHVYLDNCNRHSSRWITGEYCQELISTNQMHCVKSSTFALHWPQPQFNNISMEQILDNTIPVPYTSFNRFERFAATQPHLETLTINLDILYGLVGLYPQMCSLLHQILAFSQNTLKFLVMPPMGIVPFQFPQLPALEHLYVMPTLEHSSGIFYRPQILPSVFPNLKIVTFDPRAGGVMFEAISTFVSTRGRAVPSVEELRILSYDYKAPNLARLGTLFTNVKRLIIQPQQTRRDLPRIIHVVLSSFPSIKCLKLKNFGLLPNCLKEVEHFKHWASEMRAALGVSRRQAATPEVEEYRSIHDMKKLRSLKIELHLKHWDQFEICPLIFCKSIASLVNELKHISRLRILISGDAVTKKSLCLCRRIQLELHSLLQGAAKSVEVRHREY